MQTHLKVCASVVLSLSHPPTHLDSLALVLLKHFCTQAAQLPDAAGQVLTARKQLGLTRVQGSGLAALLCSCSRARSRLVTQPLAATGQLTDLFLDTGGSNRDNKARPGFGSMLGILPT